MLSNEAFNLLCAIREKYGSDVKGVGPGSLDEIIELAEVDERRTRQILSELERFGFISVDRALGGRIPGCRIQELGQKYLDRLLDE